MTRALLGLGGVAVAALLSIANAGAQETIKIGVILAYSGQFADASNQIDKGIQLYMKQNGDVVAGKKVEIIRKDVGGVAPDVAKRLAQELIVRDKVDVLAGLVNTPNALAVADVSAQAKKFMVIMNAATSIIITKSDYAVRTSMTLPMVCDTMATWAYKSGVRRTYTMVSDYGPGLDCEGAYHSAFKAAGGNIAGSVRMALANPDFSAYVQRALDLNPESVMIFVPAGAQPPALGKAFAQRGVDPKKIKIMGTGEVTDESAVKNMGDAALDIISAWHYDFNHDSPMNKAFVKAFNGAFPGPQPNFLAVGGYDGMHLIYEAIKKTGGETDGQSLIDAAKGLKWESPRGMIEIDPATRDIVETIYIRRVQKVGGQLLNVEFDKVENARDPVLAAMKK